jgi:hypothetical protein
MSTKSREVIWGGQIMGAEIRAKSAREAAQKAARDADRAEAEAWSIRMEGYGGPAQPSPTIAHCLNGGLPRRSSLRRKRSEPPPVQGPVSVAPTGRLASGKRDEERCSSFAGRVSCECWAWRGATRTRGWSACCALACDTTPRRCGCD